MWCPFSSFLHPRRPRRPAGRRLAGVERLEPRTYLAADVVVTEMMAANGSTLADADGDYSDWIELYNRGTETAQLAGWSLTDDPDQPAKWTFPYLQLEPGGYQVVFASGKDRAPDSSKLTTDFHSTPDGTFLVDLPDGDYDLRITMGDALRARDRVRLEVQGDPIDVADTAAGQFAVVETTARVDAGSGSGRLALRLIDQGGATRRGVINALIVTPRDGGPARRFDFGTPDSPLEPGFERVTPAAVYGEQLRFGWIEGVERSGQDRQLPPAEWHTNFKLRARGEYLGLVAPDGTVVSQFGSRDAPYPVQSADVSYGVAMATEPFPESAPVGYLRPPTPGAPNPPTIALPGPDIEAVAPESPVWDAVEPLIVTARVAPSLNLVDSVTLHYRVMYDDEATAPMVDDGRGFDLQAGDGIYTAAIPASIAAPDQMVRYYVSARDTAGNLSRLPHVIDRSGTRQSPQYFGTVITDSAVESPSPVFRWFAENPSRAHSRAGTRVSVYYRGEFYDNVYARARGGATNGSVSQKFFFNADHKLLVNEALGRVDEININGPGSDPSFVRQTLAFETFRDLGNAASISLLAPMEVNGQFDRLGIFIEQVDEAFLSRNGLDPQGALYKLVQRSTLEPVFSDVTTGVEKKTRLDEDFSDLQQLVDGLNDPSADARHRYLMDHLDLPQIINYLAIRSIIQDADDVRKNFYMYRDTRGAGEWSIFPWDKDWTFGVRGDGGVHLPHPFFGDFEHRKQNADQWNVLYDVLFEDPTTRAMFLRRLRTVMDTQLQDERQLRIQGNYERRVEMLYAEVAQTLELQNAAAKASLLRYFPQRRAVLYGRFGPEGTEPLIPAAQPERPAVTFGAIDAAPQSGDEDQQYVEVRNLESTAIDLSGWSLEGGIEHTFRAGTVLPPGGSLYVTPDAARFRQRSNGPRGGQGLFVQGGFEGQLSERGEMIRLVAGDRREIARVRYAGHPAPAQPHVQVNELSTRSGSAGPDRIELFNPTDQAIDVSGWLLRVDGSRPAQGTLPAGSRIGAGAYRTFSSAETGVRFDGRLGGTLTLLEPASGGQPPRSVDRVAFDGSRTGAALGRVPASDGSAWMVPMARPTFGRENSEPAPSPVVVSEVAYHPADPPRPRVEGFEQPEADALQVVEGVWRVTDGRLQAQPAPGGDAVAVLRRATPRGQPVTIAATLRFPATSPLNKNGAILFDYRGPTDFKFASVHQGGGRWRIGRRDASGWTFLAQFRETIPADTDLRVEVELDGTTATLRSEGFALLKYDFGTPIAEGSIGLATKAGEAAFDDLSVGPRVDSEQLEFVELTNVTDGPLDVSQYVVQGGIDMVVPSGTRLDAGASLLLVPFDPGDAQAVAAFRYHYGLDDSVPLAGPYRGALGNDRQQLAVLVGLADGTADDGLLLLDLVAYDDAPPWPQNADGGGLSLQRWSARGTGVDAANFRPLGPTPGRSTFALPGDLNVDGRIDAGDIEHFALAVRDPHVYESIFAQQAAVTGDFDRDGDVDFDDIAGMRALVARTQLP